MVSIIRVEQAPFHELPHRTSGPSGKPLRNRLPFHRAWATGLPDGLDALIFTSDLQGREGGGANRLMGVPVAEALTALVAKGTIPQPQAAFLCGDLYDYPDCHKRGGTGPVDDVYEAFAQLAPQVLAVHGNHDELAEPKALPKHFQILDGQVRNTAGLRVGGVSGIIGNPRRHQRRDEEAFLEVMESVTARRPHIILLHQGPEDAERRRRGDPGVTLSLETGYTGLTVFGHTHWDWPWLISLGAGQALNVDGRVVVLLRGDDHVSG